MAFTRFDPNYAGARIVLTNGGLTVGTDAPNDGNSYYNAVRAFEGKTTGKWYFRATIDSITHAAALFASINVGITGFRFPTNLLSPDNIGWVGNQDFSTTPTARTGLAANSGGSWFGNNIGDGFAGVGGTTTAWADGDIVDLAYDVGGRLGWVRLNGGNWNSNASADPETGVGGQPFEGFTGGSLSLGSRLWPAVSLGWFGDQVTLDFEAPMLAAELPSYSGWTETYSYLDNMLYETDAFGITDPTLWVGNYTPPSNVSVAALLCNMIALTGATAMTGVIYDSNGTGQTPGTLVASTAVLASGLAPPGVELTFGSDPTLTAGHRYYVGYISDADSQFGGTSTTSTLGFINNTGTPTPAAIPATFPDPVATSNNYAPALELVLGAPIPNARMGMDNVVVTSLLTESPCTSAQFSSVFAPVGPQLGLRWSDTRGKTFGNAVPQDFSSDPLWQPQWNRTGMARDRVFELFWSAAVKTALNGAFVEVVPLKS